MEQKEKQLMIFLAGELRSRKNLKKLISDHSFDFYAADAGYQTAMDLKLPIKKVLGDFDTADKPNLPNTYVYPSEKDQTDAEIALYSAINDGYKVIWFIAPFGGRIDHTVANINLMMAANKKGVKLNLYDGENFVFLLNKGSYSIDSKYRYYSFIPLDQKAIITLDGFKYPLNRACLNRENSLGISNEAQADVLKVKIHQGSVLCVCIEKELQ